jgi:hypothetical protein
VTHSGGPCPHLFHDVLKEDAAERTVIVDVLVDAGRCEAYPSVCSAFVRDMKVFRALLHVDLSTGPSDSHFWPHFQLLA